MQLAALLQDPTQPYQKYRGPLGTPAGSGGGGINDMMMKMMMQKKGGAPGMQNPNQPMGDFPTGSSNPMSNYG